MQLKQTQKDEGVEFVDKLISILIVNWNTREHLKACLQSLESGASQGPTETIVVDNNSNDGSAEMVAEHFPNVKLIRNLENVGFAKGVNQAAAEARGDSLLFLNSDTVLESTTIQTCHDFLQTNDDVAVVGCRIEFPDGRPQSSTFRFPSLRGIFLTSLWISQAFPNSWYLNWDRYGERRWNHPKDVDVTMGSFLLLRRAALNGEPPLDEGYFMYGEESDMCRRLLSQGWRTVHLPSAKLIHVHGGSTKTPKLEGWATEAKTRGILRLFLVWDGVVVAWLANLMMLSALLPRLTGWAVLDLLNGVRRRKLKAVRIHKGKVFWLHLSALFNPSVLRNSWRGPDGPSSKAVKGS